MYVRRMQISWLLNPSITMYTSRPAMFKEFDGVRAKHLLDMRS
jgi:hypothetical protein